MCISIRRIENIGATRRIAIVDENLTRLNGKNFQIHIVRPTTNIRICWENKVGLSRSFSKYPSSRAIILSSIIIWNLVTP